MRIILIICTVVFALSTNISNSPTITQTRNDNGALVKTAHAGIVKGDEKVLPGQRPPDDVQAYSSPQSSVNIALFSPPSQQIQEKSGQPQKGREASSLLIFGTVLVGLASFTRRKLLR